MLSTDFFKGGPANGIKRLRTRVDDTPTWLPFLVVTGLYTIGAGILYPVAFWHLALLTASQMIVFSLAFIVLAICLGALRKAPHRPLDQVLGTLRSKGRFILGGLILFILGLSAYTTYKINIPGVVPFYADPYLADIDRFLYGRNAWRVMHEAPLQVGMLVDFFYTRVWPAVLLFSVLGALTFVEGVRLQRFAWALFFVYAVLGTLLATVFASVGPIFYPEFYPGTAQFMQLKPAIENNPYITNITSYSDYLLYAYRSREFVFASGISAFPSVHVAVATLAAWFLTSFGRRCAVIGWTNAVIVQYGSIYSGWHYAIDGDASLILVSACWIALSRFYDLPLMPAAQALRG
ncbi:MAG TPA: phosphatase PAP2 family protein [Ensifer sp.]|nr:phosphatase PAP2 family protein [Ensifer sp.]